MTIHELVYIEDPRIELLTVVIVFSYYFLLGVSRTDVNMLIRKVDIGFQVFAFITGDSSIINV